MAFGFEDWNMSYATRLGGGGKYEWKSVQFDWQFRDKKQRKSECNNLLGKLDVITAIFNILVSGN